jgi:cytochrome c
MWRAILVLIILFATSFFPGRFGQENHPPDVKLVTPKPGSTFEWNSPVRYSITVSDKEDGDSKFDEINQTTILLEVAFVPDTSSIKNSKSGRLALYAMLGSNCMNCHSFNTKLIGPSFKDISSRYSDLSGLQTLIKHVKEGSKGVWGDIVMPSHPELSNEQIGDMVKWILNSNKHNDINFYIGTEGSFRLSRPPSYSKSSAISVTAGYMDHDHTIGEHSIFLKGVVAH